MWKESALLCSSYIFFSQFPCSCLIVNTIISLTWIFYCINVLRPSYLNLYLTTILKCVLAYCTSNMYYEWWYIRNTISIFFQSMTSSVGSISAHSAETRIGFIWWVIVIRVIVWFSSMIMLLSFQIQCSMLIFPLFLYSTFAYSPCTVGFLSKAVKYNLALWLFFMLPALLWLINFCNPKSGTELRCCLTKVLMNSKVNICTHYFQVSTLSFRHNSALVPDVISPPNIVILQTERDVVLLTWHDTQNGGATSSFNRWLSLYHTRGKKPKKRNVLYEYFDKCYQLLITNMWIFGRLKHQMSLPGCTYIRLGWMVQKERMILLGLSKTVNLFNVFNWTWDI